MLCAILLRHCLIQVVLLSSLVLPAQKNSSIPFLLTEYNNLSVRAVLNKTDTVNLMFHTAANAVTLTEESVKRLKSIRFTESTDSIKSWGSQSNSSGLSPDNFLEIGGLSWNKVPIWENLNSGQYTDGKFGIDLFKGRVIAIDFDKLLINVSDSLPYNIDQYQQVKLADEDDELFIEADCKTKDSVFKNRFLVHSGYSGAILFDDEFAKNSKLDERLELTGEKKLTDSYGNVLITKQAVLPALNIQGLELADVPAGFFKGAIGRQQMSIIGGDVLKRFNIVIDATRTYIYFQPNKLSGTAYRKL